MEGRGRRGGREWRQNGGKFGLKHLTVCEHDQVGSV